MYKYIITIAIAILISLGLNAQKVNYSIAEKVAFNFLTNKSAKTDIDLKLQNVFTNNTDTLFYIFNSNSKSFIIIAADYRVSPVLGYSFENSFKLDDNPALNNWLEMYKESIYSIIKAKSFKKNKDWDLILNNTYNKVGSKAVAPLLTTNWGQGVNYNYNCPVFVGGPDDKCLTGCVATAMGQVMNYHQYPTQGSGSNTYYHPYYVSISADFDTTYNWSDMTNNINSQSRDAISLLLYHAGVSVDMYYGPTASGTTTSKAKTALVEYFGYHPSIEYYYRSAFTYENWKQMMIDNLDLNRPVVYSGSGSAGGHAFVLDGYQDTTYFHFNWGWNGSNNGYFKLSALNTSGGSFNSGQSALVNIFPANASYCGNGGYYTAQTDQLSDQSGYSFYRNNTDCEWLIEPDSADKVVLSFNNFSTEYNKDFVYVYNGDSETAPLLGKFSGSNLPSTLTANSGKMLIRFTSDSINQFQGWEAEYNTIPLGMFSADEQNFNVYPNPVNDIINIIGNYEAKEIILNIYSIDGRCVINKSLDNFESSYKLDVSELEKAYYLLEIIQGENIQTYKIIKL